MYESVIWACRSNVLASVYPFCYNEGTFRFSSALAGRQVAQDMSQCVSWYLLSLFLNQLPLLLPHVLQDLFDDVLCSSLMLSNNRRKCANGCCIHRTYSSPTCAPLDTAWLSNAVLENALCSYIWCSICPTDAAL